jgi:hypothetical protein
MAFAKQPALWEESDLDSDDELPLSPGERAAARQVAHRRAAEGRYKSLIIGCPFVNGDAPSISSLQTSTIARQQVSEASPFFTISVQESDEQLPQLQAIFDFSAISLVSVAIDTRSVAYPVFVRRSPPTC